GLAVERDAATDHRRISAELSLPQPMPDHGDVIGAGAILGAGKRPAGGRYDTKELEEARRHARGLEFLRLAAPGEHRVRGPNRGQRVARSAVAPPDIDMRGIHGE